MLLESEVLFIYFLVFLFVGYEVMLQGVKIKKGDKLKNNKNPSRNDSVDVVITSEASRI